MNALRLPRLGWFKINANRGNRFWSGVGIEE